MRSRVRAVVAAAVIGGMVVGIAGTGWASWPQERRRRQAAIADYLSAHEDAFRSFKDAPLAIKQDALNFVGVPVVMFRLFPVIFPDIWGKAKANMTAVGFGPDPFDPSNVMPLGTGYALSKGFTVPGRDDTVAVNYATLTCMGCHATRVETPDGTTIRLIGGPTELGNFFGLIHDTVNDDRYTVETFRAALAEKPLGWVYGDPAMNLQEAFERELFDTPGIAAFFLEELKFISNRSHERIEATIAVYTYGGADAPPLYGIPGQLDVFSAAGAVFADPDVLTPAELAADLPAHPAPSDIMAAWNQQARPAFQWDDSVTNLVFRETAAAFSVVDDDPAATNTDAVQQGADFAEGLPAPPYPFAVDMQRARRGAAIFAQACQGCHAPGNGVLVPLGEVGTDPNRADVYTDFIVTNLIEALREACTLPSCYGPGGAPLTDAQILNPTGRYAALPLDGVWGTAPYLHNGSVPTLHHLLTGDRPTTFYRGNATYDRAKVGFTWKRATNGEAARYDTTQDGHANAGHTGAQFTGGIDFATERGKLRDLLEYLKTL